MNWPKGSYPPLPLPINRLANALVDDILDAPNDEILAEFAESHSDQAKNASELRTLFENMYDPPLGECTYGKDA